MTPPARLIQACRACGSPALEPVLSLGGMPLANALLRPEDLGALEPRYPLELVFCPACALAQITATLPPEALFREYVYFSSYADSFVAHARALAERMVAERRLSGDSLVLEAASNDGYLLQHYRARGVPVLGVEPARNVAATAEARGIPTLCEFFDAALARRLRDEGRRADVVHAHNVLAHVADPGGFVEGLRLVLKDGGLAVIEVPYVRDLVERCEFDTIYHEHLCYFSATALARLLADGGLALEHVERVEVHGGSLRVFATAVERSRPRPSVEALLSEERACGLDQAGFYRGFADRVQALRGELRARLIELKAAGRRLAGYGAAAKAAVLLNALDLPPGTLDFVADRSPHKQGRFLPGVRVPVRPPEALLEEQPDFTLLLAWNLADEVLAQQAEYRRRGGRFILPLPELRIL